VLNTFLYSNALKLGKPQWSLSMVIIILSYYHINDLNGHYHNLPDYLITPNTWFPKYKGIAGSKPYWSYWHLRNKLWHPNQKELGHRINEITDAHNIFCLLLFFSIFIGIYVERKWIRRRNNICQLQSPYIPFVVILQEK
jgi:hypothetical protein